MMPSDNDVIEEKKLLKQLLFNMEGWFPIRHFDKRQIKCRK